LYRIHKIYSHFKYSNILIGAINVPSTGIMIFE